MISNFFRANMMIMLVVYAILFFLLGFAILLKGSKKSALRLGRSLWLLAGYGFAHGLNELVVIVLRVKQAELVQTAELSLQTAELALKAVSFMFIFWLGIRLLSDYYEKLGFLHAIGALMSAGWVIEAVYALAIHENFLYLGVADNLSRYMFAFPGFFMSAIGFWLQIREVESFRIPYLVKNLKGLSISFMCATFFIGLVANEPVLWPATVFNRQVFFDAVGVPVIFFRSLFLAFATYFVIRIVDVFEVEREHRLEEALRSQVLFNERERIARELHDGIIQSIYGVGLKLEQASILGKNIPNEAKNQICSAKDDLNQVIQDLRDYIQELQPGTFLNLSLRDGISELVSRFRESVIMKVSLEFQGQQSAELNVLQVNNIIQIIRELLTNTAKYSRAGQVIVKVRFDQEEIVLRVNDDGEGFDPATLNGDYRSLGRQGLKNVFHRVGMLQGTIAFYTAPGQGTHFEITVPYKKLAHAGGVFIDDPDYFKAAE